MIDRVGQFLVNNGVVDEAAILEALTIQKKRSCKGFSDPETKLTADWRNIV